MLSSLHRSAPNLLNRSGQGNGIEMVSGSSLSESNTASLQPNLPDSGVPTATITQELQNSRSQIEIATITPSRHGSSNEIADLNDPGSRFINRSILEGDSEEVSSHTQTTQPDLDLESDIAFPQPINLNELPTAEATPVRLFSTLAQQSRIPLHLTYWTSTQELEQAHGPQTAIEIFENQTLRPLPDDAIQISSNETNSSTNAQQAKAIVPGRQPLWNRTVIGLGSISAIVGTAGVLGMTYGISVLSANGFDRWNDPDDGFPAFMAGAGSTILGLGGIGAAYSLYRPDLIEPSAP